MNLHPKTRPVAFALAALLAPAAHAAAPVGSANAWDLSVGISLIGLAQLNVGAQTSAHLSAVVATADDSQQLPSVLLSSAPLSLITVSTGLLDSTTEYVGSGGMSAIVARSSVNDLALAAGLIAAPGSILAITADNVSSQTALAGTCPDAVPKAPSTQGLLDDFVFYNGFDAGNLIGGGGDGGGGGGGGIGGLPPTGGTLVDPAISIIGTNVPLPLNAAPNTAVDLNVLGIAGATLILNEQTRSGDGVHSLSTTNNALHLTLNVANLVTADVVIAHSEASLACP